MLFPLSDDDRALTRPAFVTMALLALNVVLFGYQVVEPSFTYGWSAVPNEITTGRDLVNEHPLFEEAPDREIFATKELPQRPGPGPAPAIYLTLLTAMFMHGGLMHLGGNLLYLWIFGDNVEHRFGALPFLGFYLASGLAASIAQIALDPDSLIPTLGASGAISGVLGAYLVLFPRNRVNAVFIFRVVTIPAFVVLGVWIGFQLFNGYGSIAATEQTGGVAYGAHIGGFVAGVVVAVAYRAMGGRERPNVLGAAAERDPRSQRLW